MPSRYGQHLTRIDRQRACEHRWGPWRPYGNPEYGLMRRECAVCWMDEALTRQELEEDGLHERLMSWRPARTTAAPTVPGSAACR